MHNKYVITLLTIIFAAVSTCSLTSSTTTCSNNNYSWADSVFQTLSLDQKIAQLMMIRIHSNKDEKYCQEIINYIDKYQVGGVCFFQGGPYRQAILTNRIQAVSKIPLMVAIDGEWGLGMRLDSVTLYPRQMALGAGGDTALIYQMGASMAQQCKRMGIHVNFAPCIDVNIDSENPVINSRSFGADPWQVAICGAAYMKGMQDNGVMACAKHFPGHGDTKTDSHKDAPTVNQPLERLQKVELLPFQYLFQQGVDAVMVGHLYMPALDSTPKHIATVSNIITTELLQKNMNFNGLVFTDGIDMGGLTKLFPAGEREVQCLMAGCDVLLLPGQLETVFLSIKQAILDGRLEVEDINKKCMKMLKMKEKYVVNNANTLSLDHVVDDINTPESSDLNDFLMQKAVTLLKNDKNIIPLSADKKGLYLREAKSGENVLAEILQRHVDITTIEAKNSIGSKQTEIATAKKSADYIIVSLSNLNQYPTNHYGLSDQTIKFLNQLTMDTIPVILVVAGNPYAIDELPFADRFAAILVGYHPLPMAEKALANALCGINPVSGKLPVTLKQFPLHTGLKVGKTPEEIQLLVQHHGKEIDNIIHHAIKNKAMPGCQILIAKDNHILYQKSYGTFSYHDTVKVNESTVYDLASVTKMMATTLAIMKLYDEGKLHLNDSLAQYLPFFANSDKAKIKIYQLLTHTASLPAWIPFYTATLNKDHSLRSDIYQSDYSPEFAVCVAQNIYMKTDYIDTMWTKVKSATLKKDSNYLYSDIGFYLLGQIVESISGMPLDVFVEKHFYAPLHLHNTHFNPLQSIDQANIAPTENDTLFRKQHLQGYVHDQVAAMFGGVSGHAGLFSNCHDLYIICQMLLNEGNYNEQQLLKPETVNLFTSYYFPNTSPCRRGLGVDKPARNHAASPCCDAASPLSYGHSGFTGTFVWIDPQYDLIYIFLSNRVNPNAENNKLTTMSIRSKVHEEAYKMCK